MGSARDLFVPERRLLERSRCAPRSRHRERSLRARLGRESREIISSRAEYAKKSNEARRRRLVFQSEQREARRGSGVLGARGLKRNAKSRNFPLAGAPSSPFRGLPRRRSRAGVINRAREPFGGLVLARAASEKEADAPTRKGRRAQAAGTCVRAKIT